MLYQEAMKKKIGGWTDSVVQRSGPNWSLSPNVLMDPPRNVTQDKNEKKFSTYLKTSQQFQPCVGFISIQLHDSNFPKKQEVHKRISVTELQTLLPKMTFQEQGMRAIQNRQRSQNPIINSRNRSAESRNSKPSHSPSHSVKQHRAFVPVACQN